MAAFENPAIPSGSDLRGFLDQLAPAVPDTVAGYVAVTGRLVNVANAYAIDPQAPYRHNSDFDLATGYRTVSSLTIPLALPGGPCIGVLHLVNRLVAGGSVLPFPDPPDGGILALAAMAASALKILQTMDARPPAETTPLP